jgi:hypothetical protein
MEEKRRSTQDRIMNGTKMEENRKYKMGHENGRR